MNKSRILLLPTLMLGFLFATNGILEAQTYQGIQGYEESAVTVSYADMIAYDAAHPDLQYKNPANPKNYKAIPESEFRHGDMQPKPSYSNSNSTKAIVDRLKNIAIVSPAPAANFLGCADDGSAIPPDTYSAVGPNHILITLNTQVRILNKAGVQQATPVSLTAFWAASLGNGLSCFDPKCVYDPYSGRYIVTALSLNINNNSNSYLLIGASATNDPTGTWHLYKIVIDATNATWLDYPEIGFNKNWIVVNGNLFNSTSGAFVNVDVFAFNKANIINGVSATHLLFNSLTSDFSVCPVFTFDPNMNDLFMLESYDGPSGAVTLFKITGTPAVPVLSTVTTFNGSILWDNSPTTTGVDTGPQTGTTNKIDMDDDRISSAVYRNNYLWFAHNAYLPQGNPTRCSVEWWQVDTLGNIIQNGLVDDATSIDSNYVYPSINVNKANDVVIGYSVLASNMHPSCGYSYRAAADAPNTLRTPYIYKNGLTTYYQTFGGPNNRFGDYSATSVDPSDSITFFTTQEYSATASTWGTWVAKIYQCNVPPAAAIIGPTSTCSSGGTWYYVNPVPWATSYTWTITGTGWSGSSTTDSIQITPGTGSATLKVVVNNPCGASIASTITITATASPITTAPGTITYTPPLCPGTTVYFHTTPISGVTDYVWTINGIGWAGTSTIDSIGLFVGTGTLTLSVAGINGCGAGPATIRPGITPVTVYTSNFSVTNATPVQGQTITATYTGNAPVSSSAVYNWFFGLGTANPGGTVIGPHTIYWTTIGIKHVNLTVTDSGCTSTQNTHIVTVGASGINEINATLLNINVYPNPSDGNFSLTFKDVKHESLNIQLIDLLGQPVYNEDMMPPMSTFTKTISVGTLPAGIYWLNIRGKDTYYNEKLFIK